MLIPKNRTARGSLFALIFLAMVSGGYYLVIFGNGNFHAVTPGEAYRCAQPSYSRLEKYVKQYGIKSVINLRGKNTGVSWYSDETRFCMINGVKHYDIALSATHKPTPQQLNEILTVIRTAPRPVLIHCKAGSDRSGLVAAMWKVLVDGQTKPEADNQLSIRFGHFDIGGTAAMDSFFMAWHPQTVNP